MAGSVGSEDGDLGFQIAPMVDVVFVLMLFFMACAGSQVVESQLNINLPAGQGSSQAGKTPIIIDISSDGLVSINNQSYGQPSDRSLTALYDWLKNTIETFGSEDPVIIRPSPDAKHERIIQVLNAAAKANVKNLSFS
ncbi:MAG TPA: biopolymer transporter ExbD [Chthoniobacteraceae bacterium]|nr:biopolymer transporter ExbD [Chthoniobacteraceae bacterium]